MADLYRLIRESGVGRISLLLMVALAVGSSFLVVLPPHFLGAIVNQVADTGNRAATVFSPLPALNSLLESAVRLYASPVMVFALLFFLSSCVAVVVRMVFVTYVSVRADRFIAHIRNSCLESVLLARTEDLSRFPSGDVVHRVMADTKQLDNLVGVPLYVLASDVFDLLWISVFIAFLDWKILLIFAAVFPIMYLLGKQTGRSRRALSKCIQETEAEGTGFVQRVFEGLDTIKVFGAERREQGGFAKLMNRIYSLEVSSTIKLSSFFCLEGSTRAAGTIIGVAYAAYLAQDNPVYAGTIPVLALYSQRFYAPLANWTRFYQVIQQSIVSFHRLQDILKLPKEPAGREAPVPPATLFPLDIRGSVLLDTGRRVSLDINLTEPQLVVLRGRSGVGKTRLTKSLLSLGISFEGEVRMGGMQWSGADLLSARSFFAYASQDNYFFPGTVAENVAYPEEAVQMDRERCRELLNALGLEAFGLDDEVRENAKNLSLGEGRRLILGRALYSSRPILVLDEIDANVDADTRKKIYSLVAREKDRRPIIMISHVNGAELSGVEHACVTLDSA